MILIKEKKNEVKHRVNFLAVEVIKCENFYGYGVFRFEVWMIFF